MHEVLVNRLGGLRLPRKSVVRLTDSSDMTLDVYRGRKTTIQQQQQYSQFEQIQLNICLSHYTVICRTTARFHVELSTWNIKIFHCALR